MKSTKLAGLLLALLALSACGKKKSGDSASTEPAPAGSAAAAMPGPTPGTTTGGTSGTTAGDVSGSYTITSSKNPGSTTGYTGSVSIEKRSQIYRVRWTIANSPNYSGVAIQSGSTLGVGWGRGKAYGVVVYTVAGGTLKGVWAIHDSDQTGTEDLSGPSGLSGNYTITSSTSPGKAAPYKGQVSIQPTGSTYAVSWKLSTGDSYAGVGIKDGDKLVVAWGSTGSEAGVVDYKISGTTLDGTWAMPGGTALGSETLAKK